MTFMIIVDFQGFWMACRNFGESGIITSVDASKPLGGMRVGWLGVVLLEMAGSVEVKMSLMDNFWGCFCESTFMGWGC